MIKYLLFINFPLIIVLLYSLNMGNQSPKPSQEYVPPQTCEVELIESKIPVKTE